MGFSAAALYIPPTSSNGEYVLVKPDSPLHAYILRLIDSAWVSHPKETQWVFDQQMKFLQDYPIMFTVPTQYHKE
jgi:hypothetical protein